ncbi:MAG: PrgI family protein [Candidatus Yonathbacteria bacterium]|nr:PrgI family protein [Candidatus Yonathbacteria bacterium]NTW47638.1 PrgI family protein [Candidatus Yonathbacteria bacterium]
MQFQTPQFIEVEDKIFGPLTFKQFLYLAGGAGISFVLYRSLPFFFAALLILPLGGLSVALAFLRINDRPFIEVLEAAFNYALGSKLYIWKQEWKKPTTPKKEIVPTSSASLPTVHVPTLSQSKLKDMAWSLDIQKNIR